MKNLIQRLSGLFILMAFQASAQTVSYVDATAGINTLIAPSAGGGSGFFVTPVGNQGGPNDGKWDVRTLAGNGGTVLQNAGPIGNVDTLAVRLATTVSGITPGTYNVYAYFWSDTISTSISGGWRIGASLSDSAGQLTLYKPGNLGVTQFYSGFDATVTSPALLNLGTGTQALVSELNRRLYQVSLGTVTGNGFTVYIEGDRAMATQFERTWYDGVGFAPVPEPTIPSLLVLAGMGIFGRRKRI